MKKKMIEKAVSSAFFTMADATATDMFPVEMEPRIPTMDKPLIIESACPGFQIGGARFPAVPVSLKAQIKEQAESLKAGAIIAHVHARDPKTGKAQMNFPPMPPDERLKNSTPLRTKVFSLFSVSGKSFRALSAM